jgi:hypothetical protein
MTEPSYYSDDVLVYDNVLPSASFSKLFRHLGSLDYTSVHRSGWRKVWRLHDGDPLRARTIWYRPDQREATAEQAYPTDSAMDELVSWIADRRADIARVVGTAGADWTRLSFTPWIYPVGSGLSLHQDGSSYSGAYAYFAHQEWRLYWGGHLLVLDPRTRSRMTSRGEIGPAFLDDRQESLRAFDPGFALTIFPKPNRIVFLSPTALHLLTRVDANAGQAVRLSVAGFFHRSP